MYTVHKKENWKIEKKNTEIPKELLLTSQINYLLEMFWRNVCLFKYILTLKEQTIWIFLGGQIYWKT